MRPRTTLVVFPLLCACAARTQKPAPVLAPSPSLAAPASHDERMQWWRDARFGMFIHWGLYAIPAGEWEGKTNYGEWIRESAHIPLEEYEKFQAQFNPVNFDADAWARMAADAGMKYLVITSKHHDGFGLFDSELTTWDVMDTPFRRDVLAELSAACARHGVRFCTYHSIMDWHHPDYLPRRAWEQRSAQGADFERFRRYLHGQVAEIVRKYSPDVMWFDGEWESTWTHQFGVELFEHCRKLDPTMLVNNRVDVHRGGMAGFSQSSEAVGDFGTPEQEIPATGMPGVDWETCMTMNTHWGFNARDDRWKSARELIRMLVDVASKGGNYLLNIGPRADGTFPPECVERLAAIGAWTKTYGEALYGTQASPFEELVWGRCTTKKSGASTMLYLHVFERPEKGVIVLPGIGNDPLGAVLMGVPEQTPLGVRRDRWNLEIELPDTLPHQDCSVVALEIAGEPLVYRAPEIVADAEQFVTELEVSLASRSQGLELRYSLDGSDPGQRSPLYAGPIVLSATTTVRARAFHRGRPVTSTVERVFTRAAPRPALSADGARPGLRRQRFKGDWNALPDFAALSYSETEDAARIAPVAEEFVGLRFSGLIDIARDELARFTLTSDDGARLWIDGELVVDNDGLHGAETRVGSIPLARGLHSIRVDWFNRTGGAELDLRLGLGRDTPAPLAADKLFHQP